MTNWYRWEQIGVYSVWCYEDASHNVIWNITNDGQPPRTVSGYPDRESLLKLKGLI